MTKMVKELKRSRASGIFFNRDDVDKKHQRRNIKSVQIPKIRVIRVPRVLLNQPFFHKHQHPLSC
jgi:hypothetical protein